MQNFILYQATESIGQVNECRYALIKYLSLYNLKPPQNTSVIVYTDRPAMFEAFTSFYEHFEMKEPVVNSRYETIDNALSEFQGNVLFCETDTYPVMPLETLFEDLENGKIYLFDEGINEESSSYNLVIGLNSTDKKNLANIIKQTKSSDSVQHDLKPSQVKSAANYFRHYRNLPEFKKLLHSFFSKTEEESVPNLIKAAHNFDAEQIKKDKEQYFTLPFYKKWFKNLSGKAWSIKQYEKKF